MLKIKDDVDLKELEKFGFKHENTKGIGIILERYCYYDDCDQTIFIYVNDRIIVGEDISGSYFLGATIDNALDVIYDLIKANLVEKIEDDE